jgi:hypothetical protein
MGFQEFAIGASAFGVIALISWWGLKNMFPTPPKQQ